MIKCYLGIDLSLVKSGFVLLDGNGDLKDCKALDTSKKKLRGVERLIFIREWVTKYIKGNKPNYIAIEGYSFGSRIGNAYSIGEVGGIVRVLISDIIGSDFYIDVPPTKLKKFTTGKGNAKKSNMMLSVYKHWGEEFSNEDIVDAYALAKVAYYIDNFNFDHKLNKDQIKIIGELNAKEKPTE